MSMPEFAPFPPRSDESGHDPEDDLRRLLFSFRGRIARRTFWRYGVFGVMLVQFLSYAFLEIAGVAEGLADTLGTLLIAWPSMALTAKRWHDRNKSAWWLLMVIIPVIGLAWTLIECGLLRGSAGENRYGAVPVHHLG